MSWNILVFQFPIVSQCSQMFTRFPPSILQNTSIEIPLDSTSSLLRLMSASPDNETAIRGGASSPHFFQRPVVYWGIATSVGIWFFAIHTPVVTRGRALLKDPLFATHLVGAGTIYAACIHNMIRPPKMGRTAHIVIGRLGYILGTVGFGTGLVLTWSRIALKDPGFSIGITIGGVLQMVSQWNGYKAILAWRKATKPNDHEVQIRKHIGNMVSLFSMACGIPAAIRLSQAVAGDNPLVLVGFIFSSNWMATKYMQTIFRQRDLEQR